MINHIVPFFPNTKDNTHCFQASLKMVLKYFLPHEEYTFEELDKITAKVKGLWTWPMAGLMWMNKKGFDIKKIQKFDYKEFSEKGDKYLFSFYGDEVAKAQIAHSDIAQEIELAKKITKEIGIQVKIPNLQEIVKFLDKGYLVGCNLNSYALNNKEGYSGHFVVIKGYDTNTLILNDPGLPGEENRRVDFVNFEKAWAYPNETAKNITAFKLN